MWSRRIPGLAAALVAVALFCASAHAEEDAAEQWPLNVIILHTSESEGGVDPRAREYDERLKKKLRYNSLRVLGEKRVELQADEVGTIPLPNGRDLRVQPVHKGTRVAWQVGVRNYSGASA